MTVTAAGRRGRRRARRNVRIYEWAFFALNRGATLGKMAMKIRVVGAHDAGDLGAGRSAARALIDAFLGVVCGCVAILDCMWCLWDQPLRQCLHDKMVNSIVIRSDRSAGPAYPPPGPYAY